MYINSPVFGRKELGTEQFKFLVTVHFANTETMHGISNNEAFEDWKDAGGRSVALENFNKHMLYNQGNNQQKWNGIYKENIYAENCILIGVYDRI